MKRNVYLKMKSLEAARDIVFKTFARMGPFAGEEISVADSVGRVLSQPVFAAISSPHFHAAAMDGIAVRAEATFQASETSPKQLTVGQDAFFLNTGHVMPPGTDAVIMIEHVHVLDADRVEIEAPVFPWQNVRKMGEDIVATELLFPRSHLITPYCLGALISGGVFHVFVRKKPKILIIPTGSELVDWQGRQDGLAKTLLPGQVIESNSYVLAKLVEASGGCWVRHDIIADDPAKIEQTIEAAAASGDADIILTVGGSSAGSKDFAKSAITRLGEVLVHGVTIMPGKPIIIGSVANKPVFGIPGYPVSAIIAFEQFVYPLICRLLSRPEKETAMVSVRPTKKIFSKLGVEEFVRAKLGVVEDQVVATPLPRGAGCITSLTEAHGIIRIPAHLEGISGDASVKAQLLKPYTSIQNTIVAVGSHDNSLDILADALKAAYEDITLSSSHVGSIGGLMALKNGNCHLAGSHLLDETDGTYNIAYLRKYLPEGSVRLVNLVFREQGLIVPKNNPKNIRTIEDLGREDITIINRQAGSGTRILLDYRLKQSGLDPGSIKGYQHDEYTHMAVAVAVLSGACDVGMGIYAAAKALDLDFIPMVTEQYDLVISARYFETGKIQALLDTIHTQEFKRRVTALGGYSTERTGEILL
jgi:putative molybdopterin biosynthesis protein